MYKFITHRPDPDMTFAVDWALKANYLCQCET